MTSLTGLVQFTALAALLAMLADAAVAHAMLWANDPYWTYWVTDTLLMMTVFGVGTAWVGIGMKRGAVLTLIHVLLLTTYYWTLSPIGLPGQPEWLDLERTWITGLPIHFGVYYLGYLVAFWLLLRSRRARTLSARSPASISPGPIALRALLFSVVMVLVLGLVQYWLTGRFPGVTWFIVRIAVTTPLTLAWWATAGTDRLAAVAGGVMLALVLTAYSHYLAPLGLPNPSLRILAENPPPAAVEWLSYRQEFLVMLPVTLVLAIAGLLLGARGLRDGNLADAAPTVRRSWAVPVVVVVLLVALGGVAFRHTGPESNQTVVHSSGAAAVERGAMFTGDLVHGEATLVMTVRNSNTHRTPLPPHDWVDIRATLTGPDGESYSVDASQAMVDDPRGRFTTWAGVGFDSWHHGRSGIGTGALPPTRSDVAVYAIGSVRSGERVIAVDVPIHVMTTSRADGRLELHAGDPDVPVPGLPDGHLRVVWTDYDGGSTSPAKAARYALGSAVLLALLGFAIAMTRREQIVARSRPLG